MSSQKVAEKIVSHNQVVKGRLLIKVNLSTSVSDDIYCGGEVQETHKYMEERKKKKKRNA